EPPAGVIIMDDFRPYFESINNILEVPTKLSRTISLLLKLLI
ncbi:unnamed protein product, partial [Allacma fusca]